MLGMKIGIDAHAAEREGEGNCTYIRNLLAELVQIDKKNEYVLYATNSRHPFYGYFAGYAGIKVKQLPVRNPWLRIPFFLARESFRESLNILHVQYIAPPLHRGKLVVTIHDLGFLHHPETFSKVEVSRSRFFVRLTAKRAARVITGSEFSRDDIVRTYRLDRRKVGVIPYGVSSGFKNNLDSRRIRSVLDKYRIRQPYILSVGRLNPRKNLTSLARAFLSSREKLLASHTLVIVGKEDFDTRRMIQSIRRLAREGDIQFTGYVPDEDLPSLYSGADVFVYPSLFEGVGLPVLEAMACGVPVITSDTSSLREIVGDAGITLDPMDIEKITQAILRLLSDRSLRDKYIQRGLRKATEFSWRETARKTLETYETLLNPV